MDLNELRDGLAAEIVAEVSSDRQYIATGFQYPDGDSINIYLAGLTEHPHIHDGGLTMEKLWGRGFRLDGHEAFVSYAMDRFGVEVGPDSVRKRLTPGMAGRDCLDLCELIVLLLGLAHWETGRRASGD